MKKDEETCMDNSTISPYATTPGLTIFKMIIAEINTLHGGGRWYSFIRYELSLAQHVDV